MRTATKLDTVSSGVARRRYVPAIFAMQGFPAFDDAMQSWASLRRSRYSEGQAPNVPVGSALKRAFDLALATTVLVLLAPLLLVISLLLRFSQGGSVIFAHSRIGFGGRRFACYKFRTMVPNADEVLRAHLARDPVSAEEWRMTQKLKRDPRVTFIGNLIRKSSIDELPQLFNVLKGDMSCIGPRPVVESELERYGAEKETYLRARPGISGLWQVSGRNSLSYEERVALDAEYVRNWNMASDFVILLKTIPAVLRSGDTS